ncbi:hypothetical protein [Legionella londiniensis]|uniref:Uncharacterized protein n=1 Tax=Legionella londiniensis TaxID=45068 RepID=A0A0W0VHH4_9GAMM|nr:hypothetical protein [Legionella londiniensis]KTD19555.1 hypothetical protein Llon_2135 [Legionella londiniensis]STX92223.1 Uncharacterised protein [Legionella londiniensis]
MYIINNYQLLQIGSHNYISSQGKGAKISSKTLIHVLAILREQPKLEISEEQLAVLAHQQQVDIEKLKSVLIQELNVLKPLLSRKFPIIYISSDDSLVRDLLENTLNEEYQVEVVPENYFDFEARSLVLFYRQNYTHRDFKTLYQALNDDVYLITSGVIHKLLLIDNLYFKNSGLPSHFSNLHQLMAYLGSEIPATKNNWLLYYREICKHDLTKLPEPCINACQRGYIAYCLHQFALQYIDLWKPPTLLDQVNWFWHADLTSFSVHREVAMHSPFAEQDMKLNLANLPQAELV